MITHLAFLIFIGAGAVVMLVVIVALAVLLLAR